MIQRIQSVFLLLASLFVAPLFFLPVADFWGDISYRLTIYSFGDLSPDAVSPFSANFTLPILLFVVVLTLLPFLAIFLYKKRRFQLRLVRVVLGLALAFLVLIFFYYIPMIEKTVDLSANYVSAKGMFAPVVALIFLVLAQRFILKDEKLIRSMDRIR